MAKPKVDISLLKKLVVELGTVVLAAEAIQAEVTSSHNDYIVEMAKACGLAMGISTEAYLLAGEIQTVLRTSASSDPGTDATDPFKGVLNLLKGGKLPDEN